MNVTRSLRSLFFLTLFAGASHADDPFVFRDVASETGLAQATRGAMAHAAAWGDVDGDGKLDAWIGTFTSRPIEVFRAGGVDGPVPNMLLMRRGDRFVKTDHAAIAWMGRATGCVLVDLNNDGWTDLYVSNNGKEGKENLLYRNDRGTLEPVTGKAAGPVQLPDTLRSVAALDYDGNGLLDLLVLATIGEGPSMLLQNMGDFKFKASKALPTDLVGMGAAVGDLDNNGWSDIFVGGPNRLFMNQGRGKFREATEVNLDWGFAAEDNSPSCGAAMGDFDRDGRLDLVIGSHSKHPWGEPRPLRLFRNLGSSPEMVRLEEVTEQVGLAPLPMKTPHVEIRDFDNDGWPDLYTAVVVYKDGRTYPAIYKNLGAEPGKLPRFQETALIHRPEWPTSEDYHPKMATREFYDQFAAAHKLMYFSPGPSSDFDGDGRLDLLMPNWFTTQPSLLLKNETVGGAYLDVEVIGADKVNRNGIGTMVRAYPPGQALLAGGESFLASEQIACGYGYASGQAPIAHLGLGDRSSCDVVVLLPNGQGLILKQNVKANQRIKVDASAAAVTESSRMLAWPPQVVGTTDGTITIKTDRFLDVPPEVAAVRDDEGVARFVMAKTPPTVDLAFHGDLGTDPVSRRLWSCWGDIGLARDGRVYVGIGDHGRNAEGDGRCFIHRWDPARKTLTRVVDMNQVVPPRPGQPAWTKVHAKIDEGPDGKIYFACTLNDGKDAGNPEYHWTEQLPGAQLYQYDPQTDRTTVFANLPPKRCTATSLVDSQRGIWWCNLEAGGGNALYGLDLATKKVVYQGADGVVGSNRNFALANDGSLYINGVDGEIMHLDPQAKKIVGTGARIPDSPGMPLINAGGAFGRYLWRLATRLTTVPLPTVDPRTGTARPILGTGRVHDGHRALARRTIPVLSAWWAWAGVSLRHTGDSVRDCHQEAQGPGFPGAGDE